MRRNIKVFRYDPGHPASGHFENFTLEVPNETTTTILDVLLRLQQEQDPTLAFRFACRVNMCGSCGMVINGQEALACKTNVSDIPAGNEITLRPLNHFPVIKDLVVDMDPFFEKYEQVLAFYQPKQGQEAGELAQIRPDSRERLAIGDATECIACGCCVSSCTMAYHHKEYAGPAALNRAFTLLADSRDGLFVERLDRALESCYYCRSEFNCTEVCPKGISPSRAIKAIERLALAHSSTAIRHDVDGSKLPAKKWWQASALQTGRGGWFGALRDAGAAAVTAAGVACLVGVVYLALMNFPGTRAYGQIIPVPERPLSASEAHGLYLYATLACASCHQIRGKGGHRRGPDLSNIVAKRRTRDYLVRYIRNPRGMSGTSIMPAYDLPEQDLGALADFVLALDFSRWPAKVVTREEALRNP